VSLVACQGADAEDLNKKLRALNKKLRQVEDLKAKQTAGAVLEGNQVSSPRASGGADWRLDHTSANDSLITFGCSLVVDNPSPVGL
jgi:hypothetical protein